MEGKTKKSMHPQYIPGMLKLISEPKKSVNSRFHWMAWKPVKIITTGFLPSMMLVPVGRQMLESLLREIFLTLPIPGSTPIFCFGWMLRISMQTVITPMNRLAELSMSGEISPAETGMLAMGLVLQYFIVG